MKTPTSIKTLAIVTIAFAGTLHAANVYWTNTVGGVWQEAGNWNPRQQPGILDEARFNADFAGKYTVTLDDDASVAGVMWNQGVFDMDLDLNGHKLNSLSNIITHVGLVAGSKINLTVKSSQPGGALNLFCLRLFHQATATGSVHIRGSDTSVNAMNAAGSENYINTLGDGYFTVSGGARLNTLKAVIFGIGSKFAQPYILPNVSPKATLTVTDPGSTFTNLHAMVVGKMGTNMPTMVVSNGGRYIGSLYISVGMGGDTANSFSPFANGKLLVTGTGSYVQASSLSAGARGGAFGTPGSTAGGYVVVEDGGSLNVVGNLDFGNGILETALYGSATNLYAYGEAIVRNPGSSMHVGGSSSFVGWGANGAVYVLDGAKFTSGASSSFYVPYGITSVGSVTNDNAHGLLVVSNANSSASMYRLRCGQIAGQGDVIVADNGRLSVTNGLSNSDIQLWGRSKLTVSDAFVETHALTVHSNATIRVVLGTRSPAQAYIALAGNLTLTGSPTLEVGVLDSATLNPGDTIKLLSYAGSRSGTFKDLPEGAFFSVAGKRFQVNYGSGNNDAITLKYVPPVTMIKLYPGTGWQYADTGNRNTFAPPTGGWSATELQWPNLYWQRITLPVPAYWSSERVLARVGACAYGFTIYVNGQRIGRYQAPVTPVEVDITPYLNWGGNDVLMLGLEDWTTFLSPAVSLANNGLQLDHVPNPSLQGPMGYASWLFQRKLWTQDISVQAVPRVRIEDVFVKPSVRQSRLDVEMTVRNDDTVPRSVMLHAFVTPWRGDIVEKAFVPATVVIPAGTNLIATISVPWSNPTLWSPGQPHLYQLESSLKDGAEILDSVSTRFGFREFWVEANQNGTRRWFVLNGNRQNMRGEGMWHPYLGTNYVNTFMDWLKDNNFNTLRIENGGLPAYYSMADEKGLLIQSELPFNFNHKYEYNATFWERTAKMLEAQIRAYRNHPSVVIWGVENEVMLTSPGQAIGADLMALQTLARTLDPTRAVMHEGDGDLRTTQAADSPRQNVQVVNIHDYEVEIGRSGGVQSIMDFPNAGHAFGQAATAQNLPGYAYGTVLPDKSKPWFIGEYGPGAVFSHPHGISFLNGDQAYEDLFGMASGLNGALGLYYGFQIDGFRSLDYICGIAPWAAYYGDPRIATGPVIRDFFKPVTVRVKEWSRNVFAGATVSRTLITHNDDVTENSSFRIDWSLVEGSQTLLSGNLSFTAQPGFFTQRTLSFTAPAASTRRQVELVLALTRNGVLHETVRHPLSIFPARHNLTVPAGLAVLLYEPSSNTTADGLNAAGIAYTRLATLTLTGRPAGLLILGFASYHAGTTAATLAALRAWIQAGGTVLVNGDQWYHPPWLSFYGDANYGVQNFWVRSSIGFIRAPQHPLMSGFLPDDFKWWAPDHLIASDAGNWTKPSSGLCTVLVDTGGRNRGLGDSPLAEYPDGKGSTLVNRLLLFERVAQEPVARQLLQNILNYADAVTRQPAPKTIGVLSGNSSLATNVLARMKVPYQALDGQLAGHTEASLAATFSAVLVNNNAVAWTEVSAHAAKLQNYVQDGGTVMLRRLTADRAAAANALTGAALSVQPTQLKHPQLEKHTPDPLLDGVSNDDTFWVVPTGYRNQTWVPKIVEDVIRTGENTGVRGLLIEPRRTGVLQADSGQSYNLGAPDRDAGVDIANPGFGLVRIQPPNALGCYVVDQLLWDQSMSTAYNQKAQRYLSALLVQARQTHTPVLPWVSNGLVFRVQ